MGHPSGVVSLLGIGSDFRFFNPSYLGSSLIEMASSTLKQA